MCVILENVQQPSCKNMLQTCLVWYNWNLLYQHEVSNWKVQQNKRGTSTREPNLRSQGIHSYSLDIFSPMNLNSRDTDYILIHLYTFKYSKFYKLLVTILCSIADTLINMVEKNLEFGISVTADIISINAVISLRIIYYLLSRAWN